MIKPPQQQDFYRIQSVFAHKLADLSGITLEQAILENTVFYVRIGCHDWQHDISNPIWRQYWDQVVGGADPAEIAYQIYLSEYEQDKDKPTPNCFSYSYEDKELDIHIHFQNNFASDLSPLAHENLPVRKQELVDMFREIKDKYPGAADVEGYSWIYAYDSYKSLFPSEFIANLHQVDPGVKGNGAWGQFLTSKGEMNQQRVGQFMSAVHQSKTKEQLLAAFPIPTYGTRAPISCFYHLFGI